LIFSLYFFTTTFTWNHLKDHESLAKRYAIFRFRHTDYSNTPIPIVFAQYLDEAAKKKYMDTFKDNTSAKIIEQYLGKESLIYYVDKSASIRDYIEPDYINYISDPELRQEYNLYSKFASNWKIEEESSDNIESSAKMPVISVEPILLSYENFKQMDSTEFKSIIKLSLTPNINDHQFLEFLIPIMIKDDKDLYILCPEDVDNVKNSWDYSGIWVLFDVRNLNVVDKFQSLDVSIGNDSDFHNISNPIFSRTSNNIYPITQMKVKGKSYSTLKKEHVDNKIFQYLAGIVK